MYYANILWPNAQLRLGDSLVSQQGNYILTLRTVDNALVIQNVNTLNEHIVAGFNDADHLIMQGDGNLVLYTANNEPRFDTHTAGNPGTIAVLQDDGNFVLYQFQPVTALGVVGL